MGIWFCARHYVGLLNKNICQSFKALLLGYPQPLAVYFVPEAG